MTDQQPGAGYQPPVASQPVQTPAGGYAPPPQASPPTAAKPKGRGCLIALLVVLVLAIVAVVGVIAVAYAAGKPRDLGVRYTEADYWSAVKKAKVQVKDAPAAESWASTDMKYSGSQPIDETFTQAEVSALFNYSHAPGWPVKDMQVRFTGGSGVEVSGLIGFEGRDYPVYAAADAAIAGKTLSGSLKDASVMGWTVPSDYYPIGEEYALGFINERLARVTGLDIKTAEVVDGGLHIVGTVPLNAERISR